MRNSRVIEERETFDSAYPNTKGYDYYRNSYLQKKKKYALFFSGRKDSPSRRSHFSSDFSLIISREIAKDPVILDIKRICLCVCVCVCHSTVIKIKFKVNDYF